MNKKIAISCAIVALIVFVCVVSVYLFGDKEQSPNKETVESQTEELIMESTEESTEVVESTEYTEQDRELKFDNYVTTTKGKDSYVENPIENNSKDVDVDVVNDYEFSNGFTLSNTENIIVSSYGFNAGELVGQDGTHIRVKEEDALKTTVQTLRAQTLEDLGFSYYVAVCPLDIPADAKVTVGEGLSDYEKYFELEPYKDPTIEDWGQVLCDTIIDTAFGSALYTEIYSPDTKMYTAYVYILCERERILNIIIRGENKDYLLPYLYELTNDSISLIK